MSNTLQMSCNAANEKVIDMIKDISFTKQTLQQKHKELYKNIQKKCLHHYVLSEYVSDKFVVYCGTCSLILGVK